MRISRARSFWTAMAVVVALSGASCATEHDDGEAHNDGLTGASAIPSATPTPSPAPNPTPAPTATPTPTTTPTPVTTPAVTVSFNQDVKPILDASCVRCHGGFGSYSGAMAYVVPGNPGSTLIMVTQPGGIMNGYLSGDRTAKAEVIRRWIVENGAAQSR